MYCHSCGSELPDSAKFCDKCGISTLDLQDDKEKSYKNNSEAVQLNNSTTEMVSSYVQDESKAFDDEIKMRKQKVNDITTKDLFSSFKEKIDRLELTDKQKRICILAAVIALLGLMCVNGSLISWLMGIGAVLLMFVCLKKQSYASALMAISFSVFVAGFLMLDLGKLFGIVNFEYNILHILSRIFMYGMSIVIWLVTLEKIGREIASLLLLFGNFILGIINLILFFTQIGKEDFRTVLVYLVCLGFSIVFILLINEYDEIFNIIRELVSATQQKQLDVERKDVVYASYCPMCGNHLLSDAIFCDECGYQVGNLTRDLGDTASIKKIQYNPMESSVQYEMQDVQKPEMPDDNTIQYEDSYSSEIQEYSDVERKYIADEPEYIPPVENQKLVSNEPEYNNTEANLNISEKEYNYYANNSVDSKFNSEDFEYVNYEYKSSKDVQHSVCTADIEEDFMNLNEFIIDEKMSVMKFENSYKIYDMNGEIVGAVQQSQVSGGAKAARLLLGRNAKALQKVDLTILSVDGRRLGRIHRDGGGFSSIYVDDAEGRNISEMTVRFGTFRDSNGQFICKFPLVTLLNITLEDENGQILAKINHKWNGMKSIFTTADKYHISIASELTGKKRQVICAIALAFDMLVGDR